MSGDPLDRFDNDVLVRAAMQGIEVEAAVRTPIGRLVVERAMDDAHDALLALIAADPTKVEAIRALQNRVTRAADMCRWIKEVIDTGQIAEAQIREEDGIAEDDAPGAPEADV